MSQPIEIWKDVVGYEGLYQVSNLGRVKSLERTVVNTKSWIFKNTNGEQKRKEYIMKKSCDSLGYVRVTLQNKLKNDRKTYKVHRLVAIAFRENKNNLRCVNHINGVRHDNIVENLEWCTHKQNTQHAIVVLGNTRKGIAKPQPKLRMKTLVYKNGKKYKEYESITKALEDIGLGYRTYKEMLEGKRKSFKGWSFSFHSNHRTTSA